MLNIYLIYIKLTFYNIDFIKKYLDIYTLKMKIIA